MYIYIYIYIHTASLAASCRSRGAEETSGLGANHARGGQACNISRCASVTHKLAPFAPTCSGSRRHYVRGRPTGVVACTSRCLHERYLHASIPRVISFRESPSSVRGCHPSTLDRKVPTESDPDTYKVLVRDFIVKPQLVSGTACMQEFESPRVWTDIFKHVFVRKPTGCSTSVRRILCYTCIPMYMTYICMHITLIYTYPYMCMHVCMCIYNT